MTVAWVLGCNGLLGAAVCRQLRRQGTALYSFAERLRWCDEATVAVQLAAAVRAFAERTAGEDRWEVYWAAGVGTMGSSTSDLAPETRTLQSLLRLIESTPVLRAKPGALAIASSAGAIYAGSSDEIITEGTTQVPTTPYAYEKLKQEEVVRTFVLACEPANALIARISTIYGPGQATGKQQGLLAHIARCIVRNQPIQIFVPFDTIRDYIAVDDAAEVMIAALRASSGQSRIQTKIVAAERPATIAEIVSIFKRVTRRAPRIVTSASKLSGLYSRRVQFKSVTLPECAPRSKTSLLVGIAQLMAAERDAFARAPTAYVMQRTA